MSFNLLKGKRGIIFGALNDASIAWKVAERAVEEGAQIVLTNTAVACRMGTIDELAKKTNATIIPADATSVEDLTNLFEKAQEALGGKIDFVLHSCAMSVNMRKKRTYDDLDYSFLNKTLDISAISFHKMLQAAKKLDALSDGASVLALTYVASHRTFFGYNDMADAKSLLESIARSFGYIYGREKHVRINTISQSPTFTTAGSGIKGFDGLYDFSDRMSPLGNASADECADYCVVHVLRPYQKGHNADSLPRRRILKHGYVTAWYDTVQQVVHRREPRRERKHNLRISLRLLHTYYKQYPHPQCHTNEDGDILYSSVQKTNKKLSSLLSHSH